jgi:Tfp pilus assembly protein PilN
VDRLFAALEAALPPGVRLVSVSPSDAASGAELKLTAQGRASDDALALLQSLQTHGDFEGAFLDGWNEGREGVEISCTVNYVPRAGGKR